MDDFEWDAPVQVEAGVNVYVSPSEASCASWTARQALYAEAPLVLKQYWTPGCAARSNVLTIPLGVKGGRAHTEEERRGGRKAYTWSFASTHRTPTRDALTAALGAAPALRPSYVRYPGEADNYTEALCASWFALAPSGNSPDTWRAMEALDCGAIPVVEPRAHAYYAKWLPASLIGQFEVLETAGTGALEGAIRRMAQVAADPSELQRRRASLVDAYEGWQAQLRGQLRERLATLAA